MTGSGWQRWVRLFPLHFGPSRGQRVPESLESLRSLRLQAVASANRTPACPAPSCTASGTAASAPTSSPCCAVSGRAGASTSRGAASFDPLSDTFSQEHDWSRPDDPDRARAQQPGHGGYIEASKLRAGLEHETDPGELIRDYPGAASRAARRASDKAGSTTSGRSPRGRAAAGCDAPAWAKARSWSQFPENAV